MTGVKLSPSSLIHWHSDPLDRRADLREISQAIEPSIVLKATRGHVEIDHDILAVQRTTAVVDSDLFLGVLTRDTPSAHEGEAVFVRLEPEESHTLTELRAALTKLDHSDALIATTAVALANWHLAHSHCPNCGGSNQIAQRGWSRRCECGMQIFPRNDPAVIVRVLDQDDRILLGSNALWAHNRYSLLAGFVEAGESFEAAVVREIAEEAGILVTQPRYVDSQPWPFPFSLMVGMEARAESTTVVPDGIEILDLRWMTREQVAKDTDITLPAPYSLAHRLISEWFGGPLPERS